MISVFRLGMCLVEYVIVPFIIHFACLRTYEEIEKFKFHANCGELVFTYIVVVVFCLFACCCFVFVKQREFH